jgi:uncharacterized protein VirK/YbjX
MDEVHPVHRKSIFMPLIRACASAEQQVVQASQAQSRHPFLAKLYRLQREVARKGMWGVAHVAWRLLGVALTYRVHRALVGTIAGTHTREILALYPRVAYRYTLPYLSVQFERRCRRAMLNGHYAFLNQQMSADFFVKALDGSMVICALTVAGHDVSIVIKGPCLKTRHREGDLNVHLIVDAQSLCKAAFSIIPTSTIDVLGMANDAMQRYVLYVGQVQGQADCFDLIRQLTKACHDISPFDLMLSAMAGFASAVGAPLLVGVSQRNNMSYNDGTYAKSVAGFNYDDFWARYEGVRNKDGDFVIETPFREKPIELISSNHRKRALTKRAYKRGVFEQAFQNASLYRLS